MKIFNMLLVVLFTISNMMGQAQFSRVKINLQENDLEKISKLGLEIDHGILKLDRYLINEYSAQELKLLHENDVTYKVIIDDVQSHYINQNNRTVRSEVFDCNSKPYNYKTPEHYHFGSMGGYHTYEELLMTLDSMHEKFPHLISRRQVIGDKLTHEGRPIYWLKIESNAVEDFDKPEILYTALHHAREPQSLSQMLFYIWHLLENYDKDPSIKGLIDHTAMYFIPCINPDGYIQNELTDPNGGGMWRKNRQPADGGATGVDLNRNYDFEWAHDDFGSSSNPNSNTYRGTEGFSEPETQAIRDFCLVHDFKLVLNYHAFGNFLIYPWGYDGTASPHDATFKGFAHGLTSENEFSAGTSIETVGYGVNGSSDDWMYGELGAFAFTPEIGHGDFGFWPPKNQIDIINKSVLKQNLTAAQLLHDFVKVDLIEDSTLALKLSILKLSQDANDVEISVESLDDALVFDEDHIELSLQHLERDSIGFPYNVIQSKIINEEVPVVITAHHRYFDNTDTVLIRLRNSDFQTIYEEQGHDIEEWGTQRWGISKSTFLSNPGSLTDSPQADYAPSTVSKITLNEEIDLIDAEKALMTFYATWEIEEDFDYAQVMISTDGAYFKPLCGKYTSRGNEFQDLNQPVYEGYQPEWVKEEIDLHEYLGEKIWIQFRMVSDAVEEQDGIYIDNLKVEITEKSQSSSNDDLVLMEDIGVFPNPAFNKINIEYESKSQVDYVIYDQLGRKVLSGILPACSNSSCRFAVSTKEFEAGMYYLDLRSADDKVQTLKFVKLP